MAMKIESSDQRFKRYLKAREKMELQRDRLEEAYNLTIPNRTNFQDYTTGERRNIQIYDTTATKGVMDYSNTIQSILMPPYQRWASLVPGVQVPYSTVDQVTEELQIVTDIFFRYLEQSNFYQVSAEALMDVAISTGVMVFEEGPEANPFVFRSIQISEMAFDEGRDGKIQNFWRKFCIPLRAAILQWPGLKLTQQMQLTLQTDPDEKVDLIEGTVLIPGSNSDDDKFLYYVGDYASHKDLFMEQRDWSPWMGFRSGKTTGEILGYGPVLRILPTIGEANKMAEWILRAYKLSALGIYMVENSGVINPFTTILEPGSLVPIEPTSSGKDPIRPIQQAGNAQSNLQMLQSLQQIIQDNLSTNPLPQDTKSGVSATEISIRQQNWVRQNATAFGRLTVELIEPIINIGIKILVKKGLIPIKDFKIDKKRVEIKYESPLIAIQDAQDVQKFQQASSIIASAFGAPGLMVAYNLAEANDFINRKLGVPETLMKSVDEMTQQLQAMQQAQQAQAQQLPPEQVQQPTLPLAQ